MRQVDSCSEITFYQLLYTLPNSFSIQTSDLRHARNPAMPHLLSLECSKQPALTGVHQAH